MSVLLARPFRASVASVRSRLEPRERTLLDFLCAAGQLGYRLPDDDVNGRNSANRKYRGIAPDATIIAVNGRLGSASCSRHRTWVPRSLQRSGAHIRADGRERENGSDCANRLAVAVRRVDLADPGSS